MSDFQVVPVSDSDKISENLTIDPMSVIDDNLKLHDMILAALEKKEIGDQVVPSLGGRKKSRKCKKRKKSRKSKRSIKKRS